MWWSEQLPFLKGIVNLSKGNVTIWAAVFPWEIIKFLTAKYFPLHKCDTQAHLFTRTAFNDDVMSQNELSTSIAPSRVLIGFLRATNNFGSRWKKTSQNLNTKNLDKL